VCLGVRGPAKGAAVRGGVVVVDLPARKTATIPRSVSLPRGRGLRGIVFAASHRRWRCRCRRLGSDLAEGLLAPVTVAPDLDNRRVVHQAVDGGDGHHLIGEDPLPLGEGLVGRDDQAPGLVAAGDELEQDLGFLLRFFSRNRNRRG
jgi:hypothetical protein